MEKHINILTELLKYYFKRNSNTAGLGHLEFMTKTGYIIIKVYITEYDEAFKQRVNKWDMVGEIESKDPSMLKDFGLRGLEQLTSTYVSNHK
jgi:hypothetical protein